MRFLKSTHPVPAEAFTVVRILARGSGVIISLIENRNGERFTLKTISKKSKFYKPESVKRETSAGELLDHQTIGTVIRNWEDDDNVYLLMEKTEGTDLMTVLESRAGVPLSENLVRQVADQVVEALEYTHSKDIAHLGVTLEGILVESKALDLGLPNVNPIRRLNLSSPDTAVSGDIPIIMKEARNRLKKEIKEEEKLMKNQMVEWKKLPTIYASVKKRYAGYDQTQLDGIISESPIRDGWVEVYRDGKWEARKLRLTPKALIVSSLTTREKRLRGITRLDSRESKEFREEVREELNKRSSRKILLGEADSESHDAMIFLSEISTISHRDSSQKSELGFNLNIFVVFVEGYQPVFFRTTSLKETLQWILHVEGVRSDGSQSSQLDSTLLQSLFKLEENTTGKINCESGDEWAFKKNSILRLVKDSTSTSTSSPKIEYQWNGRNFLPTSTSLKLGVGTWDGFKLEWFYSSDSHVIYTFTWDQFHKKFVSRQNLASLQYEMGKLTPMGNLQHEGITHDPQIPLPVVVFVFILKRMKFQFENHLRMSQLLIREDSVLLSALCDVNSSSGTDPLAQSLTAVLEKNSLTLQVLDNFMEKEVENSTSSSTLFRANDPSSRIIRFYLKYLGFDWIESIFAPIISRLVASNFECEVDPVRLENSGNSGNFNLNSNMERLVDLTQEFFDAILQNLDRCPPQILSLCASIGAKVKSKFPEHTLSAMGGFFFLRYICPAMVQPAAFGLVNKNAQVAPTILRALILSAKILQNLSNRVSFGEKENYLTSANAFLTKNTGHLDAMFNKMLTHGVSCGSSLAIPSDAVIVSMETIQNSLTMHMSLIQEKLAENAELLSQLHDFVRDTTSYPPASLPTSSRSASTALKRVPSLPHRFQNLMKRSATMENPSHARQLHASPSVELLDDQAIGVKLFDFRNCKIGESKICYEQTTPIEYCAPEICSLKRHESYDGCAADVWALGIVIYGLLFGRFPITTSGYRDLKDGRDIEIEFPADISIEAKDLLQRMFCVDAKKRISVGEIKNHSWLQRTSSE